MAYSLSIQQILNVWAEQGVFSYLFPFLIIFAIVFAILQKTKLLGDPETTSSVKGVNAIIAISVGFISLLNDYVSTFFAAIFPKFGIFLSIGFVLLILIGFFYGADDADKKRNLASKSVGWVLAVAAILWAVSEWNDMFGGGFEFTYFLEEYFWGLVLLVGIGGLVYWVVKSDDKPGDSGSRSGSHS